MIKKCFALLLLIAITLCMHSASADCIDYKDISLEDLISIRKEIEEEICSRIFTDSSIYYSGIYYIGEDIMPGEYLITILKLYKSGYSRVYIFDSYESQISYTMATNYSSPLLRHQMSDIEETIHVHLIDGQILDLQYGEYLLKRL